MIYLKVDNKKYTWNGISTSINDLISVESDHTNNDLITVGMEKNDINIMIGYKQMSLKAIFFDLGDTLLIPKRSDNNEILDIDISPNAIPLINSLKELGFKVGIISDGRRDVLFNNLPEDKKSLLNHLLDKFDTIIMSMDEEGIPNKPHKKIFELANSRMRVNPQNTAFITENENHFKIYNLLFTQKLNNIESYITDNQH
jgi:histidinol phosphatase-like enzyme